MGKIQFVIDLLNKTITLDWSAVENEKLFWVGRSQGYPIQIPNPSYNSEIEGSQATIANPIPVVVWVLKKRLEELSKAAYTQYLSETPDERVADAEIIADFTPE